jgi:nucleoside-diphosphate-sugar epimerase
MQPPGETVPAKYLVSCGPLAVACAIIEPCQDLERVVAFSTTSIRTKALSGNAGERALMAEIETNERRLSAICEQRNIALTLLRPTLVYGCGLDRNISLLAQFGRRFGFIPVAADATGLRQPVHADDLADAAVRSLVSREPLRLESAACGGSTLSYREMIERTAAACGPRVRALGMDGRLLSFMVRLASILPATRGLNPEMVRRQGLDMVFDDSALREVLAWSPRPFRPVPADFDIPVRARALQLPG